MHEIFDQTFKPMGALDGFCNETLAVTETNNEMLRHQIARAQQWVNREGSNWREATSVVTME